MGDGTEIPEERPELKRSTRAQYELVKHSPHEYVMLTNVGEPKSYNEARQSAQSRQW